MLRNIHEIIVYYIHYRKCHQINIYVVFSPLFNLLSVHYKDCIIWSINNECFNYIKYTILDQTNEQNNNTVAIGERRMQTRFFG